jgi:hypothetical protein
MLAIEPSKCRLPLLLLLLLLPKKSISALRLMLLG